MILSLIEGQRDYDMGIAASLAKENAELKVRIAELTKSQESEDGSV